MFSLRLDSNRGGSTSILRQQAFPGTVANANNIDTATLVRAVQTDMQNAEKSGQWMLSSYAPFKDKPAFPGFEDRSFEEVRLGLYEAKLMGTVEQYVTIQLIKIVSQIHVFHFRNNSYKWHFKM